MQSTVTQNPDKRGWRIEEWRRDTGLGRSFVYKLLDARVIQSRKAGTARIITTSPAEFLASLPEART